MTFDRCQDAAVRLALYYGMDRKQGHRLVALLAIVGGALLLWLAPETLIGAVTLIAGLALEAIGLHMDRA
jgi:hypothetical protein